MNHNKAGRHLSRTSAHRLAMFRNMVDSLFEFEQIKTTLPKAKECRKYAERMITLGKKGTQHHRRQAQGFLRRREILEKLFDELAKRYATRPGGYTRIYHLGPRTGDTAEVAILELVDRKEITPKGPAKKKSAKGGDHDHDHDGEGHDHDGDSEKKSPAKKKPAKKAAAKKSEKSKSKK